MKFLSWYIIFDLYYYLFKLQYYFCRYIYVAFLFKLFQGINLKNWRFLDGPCLLCWYFSVDEIGNNILKGISFCMAVNVCFGFLRMAKAFCFLVKTRSQIVN